MKPTAPTRWVKVTSLVPGRNPRGENFEVDDLVESLDRSPMMHNIVARPLPGKREQYEVIAGHRRLAAAKQKGWAQVEVKVIEADDELAEQLALEENLRREDLADEAGALARLAELYEQQQPTRRGGDRRSKRFKAAKLAPSVGPVARVAQVAGQSVRDTRRKIRIAKLASAQVKKAFGTGRINVLEAEALVREPKQKQNQQLAALVRQKAELPSELRPVLEALQHVDQQLARWKKGISKATLAELKALSVRVVAAVEAIEASSGRRRSLPPKAANAATVKPRGNIADAVSFEPKSYNRKLSVVGSIAAEDRPRPLPMRPFVAATSLSIKTSCPDTCTFKGAPGAPGGCYACRFPQTAWCPSPSTEDVESLGAGVVAHACPCGDSGLCLAPEFRPGLQHRSRAPISRAGNHPRAQRGDPCISEPW